MSKESCGLQKKKVPKPWEKTASQLHEELNLEAIYGEMNSEGNALENYPNKPNKPNMRIMMSPIRIRSGRGHDRGRR